ncbi:efflux RND transporter periplasmic adaptor subunit [Granulosicoccus antarcticus]|nr:efflux RND transporter periplasmic adaptor subunit [Granulosicoccus antarcticus]
MKKLIDSLSGKNDSSVWVAVVLLCVSTAVNAEVRMSDSLEGDYSHECLIEPNRVLKLGSETQGLVDVLEVDRGDYVKAGDVVARLRSTVERGRVEQARKRAAMKGEINARKADLELTSIVLKRSDRLHKQALIPSQELDEARAQHRVAQAALRQAEDTVDQLKLDLVRAEALLAQRIIRSPIDGVVVEQHAFAGEYVQDNPVITIAQLNPLRVEVVLPLKEFGRYVVGDTAVVKPELGGPPVNARVDIVDPLLDASSGTFGIRLLLDNSKGDLVAGQKCEVTIKTESAASAG